MTHPHLAQVEAYWEALRGDRVVPLRSEIDPRGIETALESAFILERAEAGVARFRLAGMSLNDLMGMEVRGMPLTALFDPDHRAPVAEALEHIFEVPAKTIYGVSSAGACGTASLTGQMLLLPLRSDLGDISRILGCLVTTGTPGAAPHRLRLERSDLRAISGQPNSFGVAPPRATAEAEGLAERPAPFGTPAQGRPKLRIVHDADRDGDR